MSKSARILVVDDEPEVCRIVERYLSNEGYQTYIAKDGETMRQTLGRTPMDLIILDLRLPDEDGLTLLKDLRRTSSVPVIMLTVKSELIDRVLGLESGADDYLAKPFQPRELLARVRAILRRTRDVIGSDHTQPPCAICFDDFRLLPGSRQLWRKSGKEISLTSAEFDLLLSMAKNPNRVLSRDHLLHMTRDRSAAPYDRTIDVHIGRLRKKIESDPAHPILIKTVRNAGYIFTPTVIHE
jgi:two-component system, OmpR family, response regulator